MQSTYKAPKVNLRDRPNAGFEQGEAKLPKRAPIDVYKAFVEYDNPGEAVNVYADYAPELRRMGEKMGEGDKFYEMCQDAVLRCRTALALDAKLLVIYEEAQKFGRSESSTNEPLPLDSFDIRRYDAKGRRKQPRIIRTPTRQQEVGTAERRYLGNNRGARLVENIIRKEMSQFSEGAQLSLTGS